MSLEYLKFTNLNSERKRTQRNVATAISNLNAAADSALKQQAYMRVNPDNNGADELIVITKPDFDACASAFNEVAAKLIDMQAVQAGTMTIDECIAKYGIDLTEYSKELI
ncbi:hypothetical protein EP12_06665 [Alteromonas australica]|nr:hypothetical protein EP12_06665 [Alteromonas australica]